MTINRTVIVTAANAPLARALAAGLSAGGVGMLESPLPPDSSNPTHYISSGQIDAAFDAMLPLEGSSQAVKDIAVNAMFITAGGLATLAECKDLIDTSIVVDCDVESAADTCARLV
ncbi:MAG: hypothetical protein WC736_15795 [Gallionella sp.]|jgi:hypothetical protein